MSTTTAPRREIERAVRRGLKPLETAEPLRLDQWARSHFYLSAESSYIEGEWHPLPFQPGIMACISNDDVRSVTVMKSARVGYTKIIVASIGYFAEHKRRNQVLFLPVDKDAEDFTKDEIDPMLRDCVAAGDFDYFLLAGRYTLLEQEPLDSLLVECQKRDTKIVIGGPYNSGILATGPVKGAMFNTRPAPQRILNQVAKIQAVCQRHNVPMAAAALQFPLAHPVVASTIPGRAKITRTPCSASQAPTSPRRP